MSLGFSLIPDSLAGGQVLTVMRETCSSFSLSSCHYCPRCWLSGILLEQLAKVLLITSLSIHKALNIQQGLNLAEVLNLHLSLLWKQIQVRFPHLTEKSPARHLWLTKNRESKFYGLSPLKSSIQLHSTRPCQASTTLQRLYPSSTLV